MITFKNEPVTLDGKRLELNEVLKDFRVVDQDMNVLDSKSLKGKKIFLSVPSLDTRVCSMEVAKFINIIRQKEDVTCISVSMDLPFALKRWCLQMDNTNVITTSDYRFNEFAKVTSTKISELGLLTRAVFVVDENNIVRYVEYVSEVSNEPNYDKIVEKVDSI